MYLRHSLKSVGFVPLILMALLLALVVASQANAHAEPPSSAIVLSCVKQHG